MIKNANWSPYMGPFIFVLLELRLNIPDRFSNDVQIPNFIEIRPVFHADGRTDMATDRHEVNKSQFFAILQIIQRKVDCVERSRECFVFRSLISDGF